MRIAKDENNNLVIFTLSIFRTRIPYTARDLREPIKSVSAFLEEFHPIV